MSEQNTEKSSGSILKMALRYLLTAAVLVLCFSMVDSAKALDAISSAKPTPLIITALILVPLGQLMKVLKWRLLTKVTGCNNGFFRVLVPYLRACLLGVLTPGRIGDFARIVGLDGGKAELAGLTFLDRFIDLYTILFLASITLSWLYFSSVWIALLAGIACLILFVLFFRFSSFVEAYIRKKTGASPVALLSRLNRTRLSVQVLLSVITYLLIIAQFYLITSAFGEVDRNVILVVPVVMLTNVLPLTIGGFGIREWAFLFMTRGMEISKEVVVNSSLLWLFLNIVIIAVASMIFGLNRQKEEWR